MRKVVFASILFALVVMGCKEDNSGIVEIRENMFITQIDEINLNYRDYLGKTIKLEGFFRHNFWEDNNWLYKLILSHTCYMPIPSHSSRFYQPTSIW